MATVEEFQAARGLTVDGMVGRETWAAAERAMYFPRKPPFRPLTQAEKITQFGDPRPTQARGMKDDGSFIPDEKWRTEQMTSVTMSDLGELPRDWAAPGGFRFHRHAVKPFTALWGAWRHAGLLDLLKTWNGSTVYRVSRSGSGNLSSHAFGIAFDVNARWNGYRKRPADLGEAGSVFELVNIAYACGWYWGGHFKNSDGMHFELAR